MISDAPGRSCRPRLVMTCPFRISIPRIWLDCGQAPSRYDKEDRESVILSKRQTLSDLPIGGPAL